MQVQMNICRSLWARFGWIAVWVRRRGRQIVAFRLQLFLDFLNPAVELLVFAFEFFGRIVVDYDIGINTVTFDDPVLSILGIKRELRFEELTAVDQWQGIPNSNHAAPRPFAD